MKSKLVAFLLWFFLGWLSMHRFYLGKIGSGILYLITGQLFGIGWFIDLFLLSGMVDNYNTKKQIAEIRKDQQTANLINTTVAKATQQQAQQTDNSSNKNELLSRLTQLHDLKEKGVLTNEIYEQERNEVLAKMQVQPIVETIEPKNEQQQDIVSKAQPISQKTINMLIAYSSVVILLGGVFTYKAINKHESRYKNLLSKYETITPTDTLKFVSDTKLGNIEIDSMNASLFPKPSDYVFSNPTGFFAIYKFSIDDNRIALITRTPSYYDVSSSIDVFIYDKNKDTIMTQLQLANQWGDAGDYWIRSCMLYKENNKDLRAIIKDIRGHDKVADWKDDKTIPPSTELLLLDLTNEKIDTLNKTR